MDSLSAMDDTVILQSSVLKSPHQNSFFFACLIRHEILLLTAACGT